MPGTLDVVAIVGSLRRDSFNRALVEAFVPLCPTSMVIEIVGIGDLPLYNQDDEDHPHGAWLDFRARIKQADAVLFATPEYNRSVPAALKNAIDVGSRPYGRSVWAGKPAAIVSSSPGAMGAFGANHHLRQSLVFLDMPTMQQPEAYVGGIDKKLDGAGFLAFAKDRDFFAHFLKAFELWIRKTTVISAPSQSSP